MISEATQKKLLEKIITSKEFSGSKIYQNYLTYLVDATNEGKNLKEATIAIEVFGKDEHFNPSEDTIVRSHTYTLRKKLENYYYTEGRDDKFQLQIPKGHYHSIFVPTPNQGEPETNGIQSFLNRYSIITIVVLIVMLVFFLISYYNTHRDISTYKIIEQNDPVWSDYLQSELPILLVIGNHFFFNDYSAKYGDTLTYRHPAINSMEDFEAAYPGYSIKPAPEPYFPYHSIWSIPPVLSILYSANKNPILKKSSDINPQMLNEYNIIYLGSIKTLDILKHTLLESHFSYEISPHKITYTPPDGGEKKVFETSLHSQGPNEDLVLALKMPGPDKNSIFIIASYHSLGTPEIANYLVNQTTRTFFENQLKDKFGTIPNYFEALFRVKGIDKTAYTSDILVLGKIDHKSMNKK